MFDIMIVADVLPIIEEFLYASNRVGGRRHFPALKTCETLPARLPLFGHH
jgi:hypothetical protein